MQDILWCMSAVSFDSKYEMMKILGIPSKRWDGSGQVPNLFTFTDVLLILLQVKKSLNDNITELSVNQKFRAKTAKINCQLP